jgi:hypothetical protein
VHGEVFRLALRAWLRFNTGVHSAPVPGIQSWQSIYGAVPCVWVDAESASYQDVQYLRQELRAEPRSPEKNLPEKEHDPQRVQAEVDLCPIVCGPEGWMTFKCLQESSGISRGCGTLARTAHFPAEPFWADKSEALFNTLRTP